jgi:DNA-binding MarR family transcriptional regulator
MRTNTNERQSRIDLAAYAAAAETCACSNFRKASRALTQLFDHALQPSGLRSTQLIILLEIAVARSTTAPQLARRLVMDPSTLARNLKLIAKKDWIKFQSGRNRRGQEISLTRQGARAIQKAVPLWRRAQSVFAKKLGEKRWRGLQTDLSASVAIARGSFRLY